MENKTGEIEGIKLSGVSIKDLLSEKFIKKIEDSKLDIQAVSLVFIKEEGTNGAKTLIPFMINHQNSQEVKDKILHIGGANEKDLEKLSKIIKDIAKNE